MKHRLTGKLPEVLEDNAIGAIYQQYCAEWQPLNAAEKLLLRELARHEAALARIEQIEPAVLRRGSRGVHLVPFDIVNDATLQDALLAGAVVTDAVEKIARYRRMHERAWHAALATLRALREIRTKEMDSPAEPPRPRFSTEAACESFLQARFEASNWSCPKCGENEGTWLASRKVRQCCGCAHQTGLREGTIMARSRINLLAWFRAVELVLSKPSVKLAELMTATGVTRKATASRMLQAITSGKKATDASLRLAGLDRVFGPNTRG